MNGHCDVFLRRYPTLESYLLARPIHHEYVDELLTTVDQAHLMNRLESI